jgi:hypothetical protein
LVVVDAGIVTLDAVGQESHPLCVGLLPILYLL